MSQENVEIIRRLWAHFGETGEPDFSILDGEIEVHDHDIPDAPVYRGHDGYVGWMENWAALGTNSPRSPRNSSTPRRGLYPDDHDRKGSGITLERRNAQVFELRNQKVVRSDYFNDREQALEAAGLSE